MGTIFYTADTHFEHAFVAGTRGFDTAEEHDEALITRINERTTKRDQLWILGDLGMGSLTKVLAHASKLHAELHLVLGNHDPGHPLHKGSHTKLKRYYEVFESVSLHEQHKVGGRDVLLSHFPFHGDHFPNDRHEAWRLRDTGLPLLHGHVHAEFVINGNQINVGVDSFPDLISREEAAKLFDSILTD